MYEIPTRKEMKNRIRVLEKAALEAGLLRAAIEESEEKFRALADIIDRKRMEKLRKAKEKYRLLTETLADVIFAMDENLQITYMSPSIERLRGYSVEKAMAQSLNDMRS